MDIDFSSMTSILGVSGVIAALTAFGVVQLFSGFTMDMIDKVAGFFGYDPFDRDNY
jgi:hypothetical protein